MVGGLGAGWGLWGLGTVNNFSLFENIKTDADELIGTSFHYYKLYEHEKKDLTVPVISGRFPVVSTTFLS